MAKKNRAGLSGAQLIHRAVTREIGSGWRVMVTKGPIAISQTHAPMSRKKKGELLFVAECTSDEGKPPRSVYVYKSGSAFILRSGGHHMVCHPSRRTENDINREIALVYNVTVTSIKYPSQLNQSPRE